MITTWLGTGVFFIYFTINKENDPARMIHRYVKPLSSVINENAAEPQSKAIYDAEVKKYENAKQKNSEEYQKYVSGDTTREQYMAWFTQFLDMERTFRLAEVNYKIDASRGSSESGQNKPQEQPNNNEAGQQKPPMPG